VAGEAGHSAAEVVVIAAVPAVAEVATEADAVGPAVVEDVAVATETSTPGKYS
jgi:hypothetical protein